MKHLLDGGILGGIPIILLSALMMPTANAIDIIPSSSQTLEGISTMELSGRYREEFFEGLENTFIESHREEFFEDLSKG